MPTPPVEGLAEVMKLLVQRLRTYEDPYGRSIGTTCSDRVYITQAPDNCTYPYVVIRAMNRRLNPEYNNQRVDFDVEGLVYARPRVKEQEAEVIGDLFEKALLTYRETGAAGLAYVRTGTRETAPPFSEPADREVVTVRIVMQCAAWPLYITDAIAAG